MTSNLEAMTSNLEAMTSNLEAMTSNLEAMTSNLEAMTFNLEAMTSNLEAMTSNLCFFLRTSFSALRVVYEAFEAPAQTAVEVHVRDVRDVRSLFVLETSALNAC